MTRTVRITNVQSKILADRFAEVKADLTKRLSMDESSGDAVPWAWRMDHQVPKLSSDELQQRATSGSPQTRGGAGTGAKDDLRGHRDARSTSGQSAAGSSGTRSWPRTRSSTKESDRDSSTTGKDSGTSGTKDTSVPSETSGRKNARKGKDKKAK